MKLAQGLFYMLVDDAQQALRLVGRHLGQRFFQRRGENKGHKRARHAVAGTVRHHLEPAVFERVKGVDVAAHTVARMPVQAPVVKMAFHRLARAVEHRLLDHPRIFDALHNLLMLLRLEFRNGFNQVDTQPNTYIMAVVGKDKAFRHRLIAGFDHPIRQIIQPGVGFDDQRRFIHKRDAALLIVQFMKERAAHLGKENMAVNHADRPVQLQHRQANQRFMVIKQRHNLLVIGRGRHVRHHDTQHPCVQLA